MNYYITGYLPISKTEIKRLKRKQFLEKLGLFTLSLCIVVIAISLIKGIK